MYSDVPPVSPNNTWDPSRVGQPVNLRLGI